MKPFGPLSRENFQALVEAPHGTAAATIKKFDPLYGTGKDGAAGEFKWRVKFRRTADEVGFATVEAASYDEAMQKAEDLRERQIAWEPDDDQTYDFEIDEITIAGGIND